VQIIPDFINQNPTHKIDFGNTYSRGKREMNIRISGCRAKGLLHCLNQNFNISADNFTAKGYAGSELVILDAQIIKVSDKTEKEKLH